MNLLRSNVGKNVNPHVTTTVMIGTGRGAAALVAALVPVLVTMIVVAAAAVAATIESLGRMPELLIVNLNIKIPLNDLLKEGNLIRLILIYSTLITRRSKAFPKTGVE